MSQNFHFRSKNFKGGVTVVTHYNPELNITELRYAICSIRDQYSRKAGVAQANLCKAPVYVTSEVPPNQVLRLLLEGLTPSERSLAVKSILYSFAGRKVTPNVLSGLRQLHTNRQHSRAIEVLLQRSHSIGNYPTMSEINLLVNLISLV